MYICVYIYIYVCVFVCVLRFREALRFCIVFYYVFVFEVLIFLTNIWHQYADRWIPWAMWFVFLQ